MLMYVNRAIQAAKAVAWAECPTIQVATAAGALFISTRLQHSALFVVIDFIPISGETESATDYNLIEQSAERYIRWVSIRQMAAPIPFCF